MNDHTLDRNDGHDEEHKKSNEMDSMIIEHKKMLFPQTTLKSHLGTAESFRHDNLGLMRRYSEDGDVTIAHSSQYINLFSAVWTLLNRINKPAMRFETSLSVNMYQIKDMFQKVCKKRGFTIIDDEREQITAMAKQFLSIKDICNNCFKGKCGGWFAITTIRLNSRTNKITCRRKIVVKALIGEVRLIKAFFFDFANEIEAHDPKTKVGSASPQKTTGNSFFSDHVLSHSINNIKTSRYVPIIEEGNSDGEELSMSPQNLESYSFYEFRKILSSDQYAIGKKVAEFLRDFFETYGDVREAAQLLPQPMEKVFHKINETTETFFADFNYGKSETRKIMPFCKTSVEKYIFDKVFTQLFEMYVLKFEKQSAQFRQKTHEILKETNPLRHLKFLDIPQKFWLIKADKLNEQKELKEPLRDKEIPYGDAINELSKITKLRSPKEKLSVLLMMHSLMKSSVVEFHKGKEEIASMDEELPILIYVILCSKLDNIAAELNFVDDCVKLDSSLESEKRLMTNIKVSVQYIAEEWRIE